MTLPWLPGEPGDDELESLFARDREAWRGDLHGADESWRSDAGDDLWRGGEHVADWPESSAGPQDWVYKRGGAGTHHPPEGNGGGPLETAEGNGGARPKPPPFLP